jgi:hypothetical protein
VGLVKESGDIIEKFALLIYNLYIKAQQEDNYDARQEKIRSLP